MPNICPTCGRGRSNYDRAAQHRYHLSKMARNRFLAAGGLVPVKPRKAYDPADYKRWVEKQTAEMAEHFPNPIDPALGAFDHDEAEAARDRSTKSRKDRKKPYAIESRLVPRDKTSIAHTFGLDRWFIHGRYESGTARDLAFTLLIAKAEHETKGWGAVDWRKVG